MSHALVIAAADRAGDHATLLGIVVLIAAVGGLIYGLVRLVGKRRAGRKRSDRDPEGPRGRRATRPDGDPEGARGPEA